MCGNEDLKELLRQISTRLDFREPCHTVKSDRHDARLGRDIYDIRRAVYHGEADKAKRLGATMLRHMDG